MRRAPGCGAWVGLLHHPLDVHIVMFIDVLHTDHDVDVFERVSVEVCPETLLSLAQFLVVEVALILREGARIEAVTAGAIRTARLVAQEDDFLHLVQADECTHGMQSHFLVAGEVDGCERSAPSWELDHVGIDDAELGQDSTLTLPQTKVRAGNHDVLGLVSFFETMRHSAPFP